MLLESLEKERNQRNPHRLFRQLKLFPRKIPTPWGWDEALSTTTSVITTGSRLCHMPLVQTNFE